MLRNLFIRNLLLRLHSIIGTTLDVGRKYSRADILHFSQDDFYDPRFPEESIYRAIATAKQRFKDQNKLYFVTDTNYTISEELVITISSTELLKLLATTPIQERLVIIHAFNSDEKLMILLAKLSRRKNTYYFGADSLYPTTRFMFFNDSAKEVLIKSSSISQQKINQYFYLGDYENLTQALHFTKYLKGDYLEIGVYKGKSALVALGYMSRQKTNKHAYLVDLFDGFVNKTSKTSPDAMYYNTHKDTSMAQVKSLLKKYKNKTLLKLDIIENPLPKQIKKVAVANIDVDIYEAVAASLKKIHPRLVVGGVMICEDFGHTPLIAGAMLAVNQFLESSPGKKYTAAYMRSGQIFLVKHS